MDRNSADIGGDAAILCSRLCGYTIFKGSDLLDRVYIGWGIMCAGCVGEYRR